MRGVGLLACSCESLRVIDGFRFVKYPLKCTLHFRYCGNTILVAYKMLVADL